jgi:XTP/dITP diphosphohydrolase
MNIVLASHNTGKMQELKMGLQSLPVTLIPQSEFKMDEIEETGLTFMENALQKARHASSFANLPAIADDSGLCVPALSLEPGIYSARYAGIGASSNQNIDKLLKNMEGLNEGERAAYFYCVIVFVQHPRDPTPIIAEGRWQGSITWQKQGEQGFGYDPIFYVPSEKKTAAELSLACKNKLSHRGQALRNLIKYIKLIKLIELSEKIK